MENEKDERFATQCLLDRLAESTRKQFEERTRKVVLKTGLPLGYEALLRFFRLNTRLSPATLRGFQVGSGQLPLREGDAHGPG
jgi:hypothetical protein